MSQIVETIENVENVETTSNSPVSTTSTNNMIETENVFAQLRLEASNKKTTTTSSTIPTTSPLHIEDYYRFGTSVKDHISYIKELYNKREKSTFETKVLNALNIVFLTMKRFMIKPSIQNEVFIVFPICDLHELFFNNCNFERNINNEIITYWESMNKTQKILFNTLVSVFNYLIRLKVDSRIEMKVENYEFILVVLQFSFSIHSDKFPTNEEFYHVAIACAECVNKKKSFVFQHLNTELEKISSTIRFSTPLSDSPLKRYESLPYLNTDYQKKNSKQVRKNN